MAFRPNITLLLIRTGQVGRADFANGLGEAPAFFAQRNVASGGSPESLAGEAIKLAGGGRCGKNVWILWEDVWTQTLSLPAASIAGLNKQEMAQAVAFEMAALSGAESQDWATALVRLPDLEATAQFWVSQAPAGVRSAFQQAVRQAGGELRGICHPGGLPFFLSRGSSAGGGNSAGGWKRVELWQGVSFLIRRESPTAPPSFRVVAGEAEQGNWRREISLWARESDGLAGEWLDARTSGGGSSQIAAEGANAWNIFALGLDETRRWLTGWAEVLSSDAAGQLPVVAPGELPVAPQRHLAAAGLLLLLAVGVYAHWTWLQHQGKQLDTAIAAALKPQGDFSALKQRTDAARRDRETLAKSNAALEATLAAQPPSADIYRRQITAALHELAGNIDPNLVLAALTAQPDGAMLVHGYSLEQVSADSFAKNLTHALAGTGWDVSPAETETLRPGVGGGPWSFRMTLRAGVPPDRGADIVVQPRNMP